jgi:hypothetical protein
MNCPLCIVRAGRLDFMVLHLAGVRVPMALTEFLNPFSHADAREQGNWLSIGKPLKRKKVSNRIEAVCSAK